MASVVWLSLLGWADLAWVRCYLAIDLLLVRLNRRGIVLVARMLWAVRSRLCLKLRLVITWKLESVIWVALLSRVLDPPLLVFHLVISVQDEHWGKSRLITLFFRGESLQNILSFNHFAHKMLDVQKTMDPPLTYDDIVAHLHKFFLILFVSVNQELGQVIDCKTHPNVCSHMCSLSWVPLTVSKDIID